MPESSAWAEITVCMAENKWKLTLEVEMQQKMVVETNNLDPNENLAEDQSLNCKLLISPTLQQLTALDTFNVG